jgi:hypothetical protein
MVVAVPNLNLKSSFLETFDGSDGEESSTEDVDRYMGKVRPAIPVKS